MTVRHTSSVNDTGICPHVAADSNWHIQIWEKSVELFSMVLPPEKDCIYLPFSTVLIICIKMLLPRCFLSLYNCLCVFVFHL